MRLANWWLPAAVLLLVACGGTAERGAAPTPEPTPGATPAGPTVRALATIEPKSGSEVRGTATFASQGGQVTLTVELQGATPGPHALHLHEIGDCSADDASSAGGHWNPAGVAHGKWGEEPFHLGDVGNINVGQDGYGSLTLTTDKWSVGTGASNDVVGKSVVVHTQADDFISQPTGAAGGRIGCAVIQQG